MIPPGMSLSLLVTKEVIFNKENLANREKLNKHNKHIHTITKHAHIAPFCPI